MTITEANKIWNDCYNSNDLSLWGNYTTTQRLEAIQTRNAYAKGGVTWEVWNISDRD